MDARKESLDGVLQRLPPFGFGNSVEINESGPVLGAGSRLARMTWGGLALEDDGERLMALLSIVARRAIAPDALRHIGRRPIIGGMATKHWPTSASSSPVSPRVQAKEDAYRLCLAEYLLDQGMAPSALMKELGFDPGVLNFIKCSPNQPRVPAGNGEESGRWTDGDGSFVVAVDDSEPGEKHRLGQHESSDYVDPADQHHHYIQINPLESTLPPSIGPGPFARYGVPAGPGQRPTKSQRDQVQTLGQTFGCHTCGTKNPGTATGRFFCDHQKPTALNRGSDSQLYLPHCKTCSGAQGGAVNSYKNIDR